MTTSEPLSKINEADVWKELTAIITGDTDYWRLQLSLVLVYELSIVLISKEHGCEYVRDKVAAETYGDAWYELLHVSNKFRHNYYDKAVKIKYLSRVISTDIMRRVLMGLGYPKSIVDKYNTQLAWLLDNL